MPFSVLLARPVANLVDSIVCRYKAVSQRKLWRPAAQPHSRTHVPGRAVAELADPRPDRSKRYPPGHEFRVAPAPCFDAPQLGDPIEVKTRFCCCYPLSARPTGSSRLSACLADALACLAAFSCCAAHHLREPHRKGAALFRINQRQTEKARPLITACRTRRDQAIPGPMGFGAQLADHHRICPPKM